MDWPKTSTTGNVIYLLRSLSPSLPHLLIHHCAASESHPLSCGQPVSHPYIRSLLRLNQHVICLDRLHTSMIIYIGRASINRDVTLSCFVASFLTCFCAHLYTWCHQSRDLLRCMGVYEPETWLLRYKSLLMVKSTAAPSDVSESGGHSMPPTAWMSAIYTDIPRRQYRVQSDKRMTIILLHANDASERFLFCMKHDNSW